MVQGAYYVQRQVLSAKAFWISVPFGILVALVLLANNIRDIGHDQSRKIRTLAILLGRRRGLYAYLSLMTLAYLGILLMTLAGILSLWALIVFLTLPLAFQLLRKMINAIPVDADAQTAKLDTAFGILLVVALALEAIIG